MSTMRNTACMTLIAFFIFGTAAYGQDSAPNPYPTMAPVSQYLMSPAAEIEMARSAAPASISGNAEVLILGKNGYTVAAKGTNGWVCLVERMWSAGLDDPEFWNPKGRGPACFNPLAVQSVLPFYVARTNWALAGDTREELASRLCRSSVYRSCAGVVCVDAFKGGLSQRRSCGPVATSRDALHRFRP